MKTLFVVVSTLLTAITSSVALGLNNSFDSEFVRARPAFSEAAHAQVLEGHQQDYLKKTRSELGGPEACPLAHAYAKRILQRIIDLNGLTGFQKSNVGPDIVVSCPSAATKTATALDSVIELSSGEILNLASDDEIAFVVAHELAHVSLGHLEAFINAGRSEAAALGVDERTAEFGADDAAIRMLVRANFNPNAASSSLLRTRKAKGWIVMGFDFSSNSHAFAERQDLIDTKLKKIIIRQ